MQHHGLPTRLLDWTESPLVALHFALHRNISDSDAAVMVLAPTRLNEWVLGKRWFPDRNDPLYRYRFLKAFYRNPARLPWHTGVDLPAIKEKMLPLAIRPIITHERMISQRACFTIHGDDSRPIEAILQERKMDDHLIRFIVRAKYKRQIELNLKKVGITRSVVFPDLAGIAEDIISRSRREMRAGAED